MTLYRRRMLAQRRQIALYIAVMAVVALAMALFPMARQQREVIQDKAGLDAFLAGSKWSAPLDVQQLSPAAGTLRITSTHTASMPVVIPGAPPLPDITDTRREVDAYTVYTASVSGTPVVLLCQEAPPAGRLLITRKHADVRAEVLRQLPTLPQEAYVLTVIRPAGARLWLAPAVLALLAAAAVFSPLLDRYSSLGRQLAAGGNYRAAASQLRWDLNTPLLATGGMALTEHALLIFRGDDTVLIPSEAVRLFHITPPADAEEPCWEILVGWVDRGSPQQETILLYTPQDVDVLRRQLSFWTSARALS